MYQFNQHIFNFKCIADMHIYIPSLHRNTFNFISIASPAFWLTTDVSIWQMLASLTGKRRKRESSEMSFDSLGNRLSPLIQCGQYIPCVVLPCPIRHWQIDNSSGPEQWDIYQYLIHNLLFMEALCMFLFLFTDLVQLLY